MAGEGLTDILTALQQAVTAANNLTQIVSQATVNSSSLRVQIAGVSTTTGSTTSGTVTQVNSGTGLTGGPITTAGTLAVSLPTLTNSISSDIGLTNTSSYFDGPTVAQGSSGTWFATGSATVLDTGGAAEMSAKLWDGTTVVDSLHVTTPAANFSAVLALSGAFTSPSSNIRISVIDTSRTTGLIKASQSGLGKDSTITVVRIA